MHKKTTFLKNMLKSWSWKQIENLVNNLKIVATIYLYDNCIFIIIIDRRGVSTLSRYIQVICKKNSSRQKWTRRSLFHLKRKCLYTLYVFLNFPLNYFHLSIYSGVYIYIKFIKLKPITRKSFWHHSLLFIIYTEANIWRTLRFLCNWKCNFFALNMVLQHNVFKTSSYFNK